MLDPKSKLGITALVVVSMIAAVIVQLTVAALAILAFLAIYSATHNGAGWSPFSPR